jgi:hypothetical protein
METQRWDFYFSDDIFSFFGKMGVISFGVDFMDGF